MYKQFTDKANLHQQGKSYGGDSRNLMTQKSLRSPERQLHREPIDTLRHLDDMLRVQEKLLSRYQRNEQKYKRVLSRINSDIGALKLRTNFVRVDNGRTTKEYLSFNQHNDRFDRVKRLECLGLLDSYQQSLGRRPQLYFDKNIHQYSQRDFSLDYKNSPTNPHRLHFVYQ